VRLGVERNVAIYPKVGREPVAAVDELRDVEGPRSRSSIIATAGTLKGNLSPSSKRWNPKHVRPRTEPPRIPPLSHPSQ
jgi:hypothetical protein